MELEINVASVGRLKKNKKTRPDTRLPQSRAGGQGQCWRRSLDHLGRSSKLNQSSKDRTWSAVPDALLSDPVKKWSESRAAAPQVREYENWT